MDFKLLARNLGNPYWHDRPMENYIARHPATNAACGPGIWFMGSTPEDRRLWNLAWGSQPQLDLPGPMAWEVVTHFSRSLAMLREVGQATLRLDGPEGKAEFTLLDLSNLLPMEDFYPMLMRAKRRNGIPAEIRAGIRSRLLARGLPA